MGTASASASVDGNGKTTVETKASVKTNAALNLTVSGSQSSDGSKKMGVAVSAGTTNATVKTGVSATNNGKSNSVEVNASLESKKGNTKVTNTVFIKAGN